MPYTEQLQLAIEKNVSAALDEDVGSGDLTADLIPATATARAIVVSREAMTVCGQEWVNEVFQQLDSTVVIEWLCNDGDQIKVDAELCIISGPARSILTGERTALNFLQLLSATATRTTKFVQAASATSIRILDTRKTIPGLRLAQKYAVRCGGGENHRVGLFDALLIKENHIISAGGIDAAVAAAKKMHHDLAIEVEVESITELREALRSGADRLLLDNFDIEDLQRAVFINQEEGKPPADLEASGGVSLETIAAIAETGVNYVSIGALTKDLNAIDLSMRFRYDT